MVRLLKFRLVRRLDTTNTREKTSVTHNCFVCLSVLFVLFVVFLFLPSNIDCICMYMIESIYYTLSFWIYNWQVFLNFIFNFLIAHFTCVMCFLILHNLKLSSSAVCSFGYVVLNDRLCYRWKKRTRPTPYSRVHLFRP